MEVLHVVLYGRGHGQNMRQDPEEAIVYATIST